MHRDAQRGGPSSDVAREQQPAQAIVTHELVIPQLVDIPPRSVEWVEPIRNVEVKQDPEVPAGRLSRGPGVESAARLLTARSASAATLLQSLR